MRPERILLMRDISKGLFGNSRDCGGTEIVHKGRSTLNRSKAHHAVVVVCLNSSFLFNARPWTRKPSTAQSQR